MKGVFQLREDKLPHKLQVVLSPDINNEINDIEYRNRDNEVALIQWKDGLSAITNQISNTSIAWDNQGIVYQDPNDIVHTNIFGHNVAYTIETDYQNGRNYVDLFYFELNPEDYGLYEGIEARKVIRITESDIRTMVREALRRML